MFSFKRSLIGLAGFALVVGLVALFSSTSTWGQGQGGLPDNAARHAFQASVTLDSDVNNGTAQVSVPAGTRLVIEHVSAESRAPFTSEILRFDVKTSVGGSLVTHYLVSTEQGGGGLAPVNFNRVSQPVRLYADPPSVEVNLDVPLTPQGPTPATGSVTLSGYLVDVP
jgi:hypothetical protein